MGFALGLGGATTSDVMFFRALRARKITSEGFSTLETLSRVIWTGLGLLVLSGLSFLALMYFENGALPILQSSRFQAKLTLVGIVLVNGVVFKFLIMPVLKKHQDQILSAENIGQSRTALSITGAISIVSWYSILVLSVLPRTFRPPYLYFIGVYLVLVILAMLAGQLMISRSIRKV